MLKLFKDADEFGTPYKVDEFEDNYAQASANQMDAL
jgi:hypothetical protein